VIGTIHQLHARYRSDDAGRTWVRIDDDQHQYANADVPLIIGDPRIYGRVYFAPAAAASSTATGLRLSGFRRIWPESIDIKLPIPSGSIP